MTVVPNLFGTRDQLCGRQFFHGPGQGDGFGTIQTLITFIVHFISIIIISAPPQIIRD